MREAEHPYYVSTIEYAKAKAWIRDTARPAAVAKQRSSTLMPSRHISDGWRDGFPYKEEYSFIITPTSMGPAVSVEYKARGVRPSTYDVSDYDSW